MVVTILFLVILITEVILKYFPSLQETIFRSCASEEMMGNFTLSWLIQPKVEPIWQPYQNWEKLRF